MSTRAEILRQIHQLPEQEQQELLEDLFMVAPHLEPGFANELERRCQDADEHPESLIPLDEFLAELRQVDD